jgi:hypothetical protein
LTKAAWFIKEFGFESVATTFDEDNCVLFKLKGSYAVYRSEFHMSLAARALVKDTVQSLFSGAIFGIEKVVDGVVDTIAETLPASSSFTTKRNILMKTFKFETHPEQSYFHVISSRSHAAKKGATESDLILYSYTVIVLDKPLRSITKAAQAALQKVPRDLVYPKETDNIDQQTPSVPSAACAQELNDFFVRDVLHSIQNASGIDNLVARAFGTTYWTCELGDKKIPLQTNPGLVYTRVMCYTYVTQIEYTNTTQDPAILESLGSLGISLPLGNSHTLKPIK